MYDSFRQLLAKPPILMLLFLDPFISHRSQGCCSLSQLHMDEGRTPPAQSL